MAEHLTLLELEVTAKCQLECSHCYASSGPRGRHGTMRVTDWQAVVDQAAEIGVPRLQLIGGEPTLYPGLARLVRDAVSRGLEVEVYSNLVRVTPEMWQLFTLPGVRLASSYYSDDEAAHDAVTQRRSQRWTRANIEKALELGIPLRVAVVEVNPGQGVERARATLRSLGVDRIDVDRMRGIGRGVRPGHHGIDQLCGRCGDGRMAVLPAGQVVPCVLSRWMTLGTVADADLCVLYERARRAHQEIVAAIAGGSAECSPPTGDGKPPIPPACPPHLRPCPPPPSCPPPRR
jgi:hypothetical protein